MGSASASSILTTLVTYLQRLGISVKMPNIPLSPTVQRIIGFFMNLVTELQTYIPAIPDFDVRATLILICFFIPFLIDLVFVVFMTKLGDSLMHLLDIACFAIFTYFLSNGIFTGWPVTTISYTVLFGIVVLVRIIIMVFSKMQKSTQYQGLAKEICGYYLRGIIPGSESTKSMRSLHEDIVAFSNVITIVPKKTTVLSAVILFTLGSIFFVVALWTSNVFTIVKPLPRSLQIVLTAIAIVLSLVFYVIFILKVTRCGRSFITKFKQFCLRWGLKILITVLDMLYIPILEVLIVAIIPKRIGCEEGYYFYSVQKNEDDFLWPFIDHPSQCLPCSNMTHSYCESMCDAVKELRIPSSPALNYVEDIIEVLYPFILYTIFGVMIGLPLLWGILVKRNKMFVMSINVFGETSDIKWQAILHRLQTTATYIFEDFKLNKSYWGVYLLMNKFILMIIDTISNNYLEEFNFLLPIFFMISAGITIYFKPYINKFNNFYQASLDVANLLFAIILIVGMFGVEFPAWLGILLIAIVFLVPFVLVFFIICSPNRKIGTPDDYDDFTFIRTPEEEEEIRLKRENLDNQLHFLPTLPKATRADKKPTTLDQDSRFQRLLDSSDDGEGPKESNILKLDALSDNEQLSDPKPREKIPRGTPLRQFSSIKKSQSSILYSFSRVDFPNEESESTSARNNLPEQFPPLIRASVNSISSLPTLPPLKPEDDKPVPHDTQKVEEEEGSYEYEYEYEYETAVMQKDDQNTLVTNLLNEEEEKEEAKKENKFMKALEKADEKFQREQKERTKAAAKAASDLLRLDKLKKSDRIPENEVPLTMGRLATVAESLEIDNQTQKGVPIPDEEPMIGFTVNKKITAIRMTKMYQTLNVVLDGATLDFLTTILNSAVLLGALGVGWYLGSLFGKYETAIEYRCD